MIGVCILSARDWEWQVAALRAGGPWALLKLQPTYDHDFTPAFTGHQLDDILSVLVPGATLIIRTAETRISAADIDAQWAQPLPETGGTLAEFIRKAQGCGVVVWAERGNEPDIHGAYPWPHRHFLLDGVDYLRLTYPGVRWIASLPTHRGVVVDRKVVVDADSYYRILLETDHALFEQYDAVAWHVYGDHRLANDDGQAGLFLSMFERYVVLTRMPFFVTEIGINDPAQPWAERSAAYVAFSEALRERFGLRFLGATAFALSTDPRWYDPRQPEGTSYAIDVTIDGVRDGSFAGVRGLNPTTPTPPQEDTMTREASVYVWYYNGTEAKAEEIATIGATVAYLKAGGDRGVTWIPDPGPEGFENEQWADGYLTPLTSRGIDCRPWFYNWYDEADKQSVIDALASRWAEIICLNPETEWRVQSQHNPFQSLAQANELAAAWVNDLRARIRARFGRVPLIGYSSVPTWTDFPYEGFDAACDFGMPQDYWPDELMAPDGETGSEAGEDQVEAHLRRVGKVKPCYPIITASREYDDAGVIGLAHNALGDYPDLAGLSAWEAGNAGFQAEAMRAVFALLRSGEPGPSEEVPSVPTSIVTPATDWGGAGVVVLHRQLVIARNPETQRLYLRTATNGTQDEWIELTA